MPIRFLGAISTFGLVGTLYAHGLFFGRNNGDGLGDAKMTSLATNALDAVVSTIDRSAKSVVLPRQCLTYAGAFELEGVTLEMSAETNVVSDAILNWMKSERAKGRQYKVIGQIVSRVCITRHGQGLWDVFLYAETNPERAKEIAVQSFFRMSSKTDDAIARSIEICPYRIGDYCLSWRSSGERKDFLVFVRGGCAVVVRGDDALKAASMIDGILCECGRAYERGEIITIATAAERLSKKLNSEGVRSAASKRSTE